MLRNAENAENADCDLLTTSPTDANCSSSQLVPNGIGSWIRNTFGGHVTLFSE